MEEKKKTKTKPKAKKVKNKKANVQTKDTKMKFKYKHPKAAIAIRIALIIFLILCVIGAGVLVGLIFGLWGDDFKIDISDLVLSENSTIYDAEGGVLAELNGDENRKIVTLEEMSPYLPKAYIAIEDERFEQHHGVDIKRTGAAILSFITHGGKSTAGGGSTITQQVVKNITKDDDSKGIAGVTRKIKEWAKAYQIEDVLSKDQILELYLNLIFIGGKENRGVEIGAEYYFNTTAKDLSIAQCAFLAGINNSPNSYSPYSGKDVTEKITKRTKTVLSQMKKFNYITQEEYDQAVAEVEAGFNFENGAKGNVYSSHTDALINQLINQLMDEKQISENAAQAYLYSSGLKIYSTEVPSVQSAMEAEAQNSKYELTSKTTGNKAQAAMVVIEPSTGYVVGCIGQLGEKTESRGLNRAVPPTATSAGTRRSAGSSFKPLADLIPGIEEGTITPATIYYDSYTIFNEGTPQKYDPKNYNGFTGKTTLRRAVTTSQNIPFIKVMAELGNEKSMEYLKKMGFQALDDKKDSGLSVAIGGLTNGVSVLEMASAYAMIANDGTYIEPTFYSKVVDSDGKTVLEPQQKTERVCSADTAYMVKNLLKSVVEDSGATASYCRISGIDLAAKTGTTNGSVDRWLCGFTNYYAAATWYGYDIQEEILYKKSPSNPAGGLFSAVMKKIHTGLASSTFAKTDNIVTATVCKDSGLLATDKCSNTGTEVFIQGHLPEECDAHKSQYTICTASGKLANEFCPAEDRQTISNNYVVEKERLGLWNTPDVPKGGDSAPTDYCDIHQKPEEKPETSKPDDKNNDDKNNNTVDDDKKNTIDNGNTSDNTNTTGGDDKNNTSTGNNTTGDNTNTAPDTNTTPPDKTDEDE